MKSNKVKINIMASEIGYTSSALDYSHPTPRYTDLGNGKFVRQIPVNSITNANTITFSIPPTDDFIDLQESFLKVTLQVKKKAGGDLIIADNVVLSDNVIGSLFKAVTLRLNGERITTSNVYQAFENYFVTRFGVSKAATEIHLKRMQGLTSEEEGKNDDNTGKGWIARKKWTELSKKATFIGPIPCDFFRSCTKFLPPHQVLNIEFKLNEAEFALTALNGEFKFELTNIEIFTRQVSVASSTTLGILKYQATKPLIMNFTSVEIQSFTISAGKSVEFIRGIFPHQRPNQIFMVLVETDRLNGNLKKDPYKFSHGFVEKVVLRQNGVACMTESIITNFENDSGGALASYKYVMEAFNVGLNGRDANLTYDQFINGSTMWACTLAPDMDANNGVGLLETTAQFEADIYVKSGHNNPDLTALFIGKFGKSVFINADNRTSVV